MEHVILAVAVWLLATLTLTTGIGAGVVYTPMFVIFYELDIPAVVATSIVIQLAGVGTTALGHVRGRHTDHPLTHGGRRCRHPWAARRHLAAGVTPRVHGTTELPMAKTRLKEKR